MASSRGQAIQRERERERDKGGSRSLVRCRLSLQCKSSASSLKCLNKTRTEIDLFTLDLDRINPDTLSHIESQAIDCQSRDTLITTDPRLSKPVRSSNPQSSISKVALSRLRTSTTSKQDAARSRPVHQRVRLCPLVPPKGDPPRRQGHVRPEKSPAQVLRPTRLGRVQARTDKVSSDTHTHTYAQAKKSR